MTSISQRIIIEDYSAQWPLHFTRLKAVYETHLDGLIQDIQHVGSTSVVGLAAKPVIDIDLIADSHNLIAAAIEKIKILGYEHLGDRGIKDRESFQRTSSIVPIDGSGREWPLHNLYVCLSGSLHLRNHLALRDFLRANPEKAMEYGALKKELIARDPYDMDLYIKRKTPFIVDILATQGFEKPLLDDIRKANNAL